MHSTTVTRATCKQTQQIIDIILRRIVHCAMPAGVSWGQYLKVATAAMVSMLAGSQAVHVVYKPLEVRTS